MLTGSSDVGRILDVRQDMPESGYLTTAFSLIFGVLISAICSYLWQHQRETLDLAGKLYLADLTSVFGGLKGASGLWIVDRGERSTGKEDNTRNVR